jgi:hypothetical protein
VIDPTSQLPTRIFGVCLAIALPFKSPKLLYISMVFFMPMMTSGAPQAQGGRFKDNDPSLIEAHRWFG